MRQTLFYIPTEIYGVPIFGFGVLLALWAVGCIALLTYLVRKQGFNAETRAYLPVLGALGLFIVALPKVVGEEQGLPIRGYGVMLLLAVSSSVALLLHRARRRRYDADMILSLSFWLFAAGIVGARLFYVIEYWEPQFHKPTLLETVKAVLNITQGGLVVFGSLLGGAVAALIFVQRHRLSKLEMGDLLAPSLVLGIGIGRIGCMFNGCCFGGECDLPWAVRFPWGSPPFAQQTEQGKISLYGIRFSGGFDDPPIIGEVEPGSLAESAGLAAGDRIEHLVAHDPRSDSLREFKISNVVDVQRALLSFSAEGTELSFRVSRSSGGAPQTVRWTVPAVLPRSLPVHPAQIYSAIDCFLLLFFLLAYEPFQRRSGEVLALFLTIHPATRFLLEVIRTDEASMFGTGLSISQLISVVALAGAAILWAFVLRQPAMPRTASAVAT
jgi:phosphatidylglycerol:prolipoprotein diacylglycerol transferase